MSSIISSSPVSDVLRIENEGWIGTEVTVNVRLSEKKYLK